MADKELLKRLRQGAEEWNEWRMQHVGTIIQPMLSGANLSGADLSGTYLADADLSLASLNDATLSGTNLTGADLSGANLSGADLSGAHLSGAFLPRAQLISANLSRANLASATLFNADLSLASLNDATLSGAFLSGAQLTGADLSSAILYNANLAGANLSRANLASAQLFGADLSGVDLAGADLSGAHLSNANLYGAHLSHTRFAASSVGYTVFSDLDLRGAEGLETVANTGPSEISIGTIYRSEGKIPEVFLRNCGVPESFIVQIPALVAAMQPIQFYSCFISYSSKDQGFAERLQTDLQARGVRVWFAPHDMRIGAHIRPTIDQSIRVYDKLLLVLSKASVSSQWVEQEVETALRKERRPGAGAVLFPVRLDGAVLRIDEGWPALVKHTRHVGDFTRWRDHDSYQVAFERLLRDLKAGA